MKQPNRTMLRRAKIWLPLIIAAVVIYLSVKLFDTAVIRSDYYNGKARSQQTEESVLKASRGTIYDSNQKILAQSKTIWNVVVSPRDIELSKDIYNEAMKKATAKKTDDTSTTDNAVPADGKFQDPAYDENVVFDEAEPICRLLNEVFGLDYNEWYAKVHDKKNRGMAYLIAKRNITREQKDAFEKYKKDHHLSTFSVHLEEDTKRSYPNNEVAGAVIGFVNSENKGVYGLERYYNEYLSGINGKIITMRAGNGKSMPYGEEGRFEAQNGSSLVLTLDTVLQHYLEKNLEYAVVQHKAAWRATGIMMNPSTGEIYAMATSPGFNLNNPSEQTEIPADIYASMQADAAKIYSAEHRDGDGNKIEPTLDELEIEMLNLPWRNKAISELYFPGSVFKVITMASALEEKKVNLQEIIVDCHGSAEPAPGVRIKCWSSGHGPLTLQQAITKSCNPAFMEVGRRLGSERFSDYLEAFGFTEKTGIDLPDEADSYTKPRQDMGVVELASSSFGQTNKVTPIQMITAYAAAINGGYLVTPHVADKIIDKDGNVVKTYETNVKRQVISEETSAIVRDMLEQVVESNGGSNAAIRGYRIGGKSGTTEKLDEWSSANMRYVSTFGAFTPANEPKVIMLVCVDEPLGGFYYGSAVAAPVVSAVFKEGLAQIEVYPQYTAEEQAMQDTVVPFILGKSVIDAATKLNTEGLSHTIVGTGDKVVRTIPDAGQPISRSGTIVIYLSEETIKKALVPNVENMTVTEASKVITDAGLNIRVLGGAAANERAKAVSQDIDAGTETEAGNVVGVTFVLNDETG